MSTKEKFAKAQDQMIERDDVVVQAAKLIDPSAFELHEYEIHGCLESIGELQASLKRYQQARALRIAHEVLKLATSHEDLKSELIEHEIQGFKDLGVPTELPTFRKTIEEKYE